MARAAPPPPFLDALPPPLVVRGLANLLLIVFVLALVLSVVVKLPVTVSGRFALSPVRGADPLRAPRGGVVAEVAAVEGSAVEKGAALFRIRSELAGDRAAEAATLELTIRGAEARLVNQRARFESQNEADREQRRGLERQAASLGREIALAVRKRELAAKILDHARQVYAERLTSFEEVKAKEVDATTAEMDVARLRTDEEQARGSAERLRLEMDVRAREMVETERELREDADRARVRLETLRSAPSPSAGNEIVIAAPCTGTVARLHVRAPAAVVAENDPLCELVCAGEELRAEISVVDSGVGLVVPGQRVKLFYDAFPYQRHGVRLGTVRWIGPPGAEGPARRAGEPGAATDPAFRVLADLDDRELYVRGAPYPLLPGMTGRAEIVVTQQSALAYVLEPVRALRENLGPGR